MNRFILLNFKMPITKPIFYTDRKIMLILKYIQYISNGILVYNIVNIFLEIKC
jgi:hypothetical protein